MMRDPCLFIGPDRLFLDPNADPEWDILKCTILYAYHTSARVKTCVYCFLHFQIMLSPHFDYG